MSIRIRIVPTDVAPADRQQTWARLPVRAGVRADRAIKMPCGADQAGDASTMEKPTPVTPFHSSTRNCPARCTGVPLRPSR